MIKSKYDTKQLIFYKQLIQNQNNSLSIIRSKFYQIHQLIIIQSPAHYILSFSYNLLLILKMNTTRKSMKGRKSFKSFDNESRGSTPDKYTRNQKPMTKSGIYNTRVFDPKQFIVAVCTQRDIEVYKQIFDYLDFDNDGMLTPMDFRKAMIQYGNYHPKRNYIYQMIAIYDLDESGQINFKEFVQMMTNRPAETDKVEDIRRVFSQIDQDQKGYITDKDLLILADQLQEQLNTQQIEQIMKNCDPNSEGKKISWQAFLAFNKRKEF